MKDQWIDYPCRTCGAQPGTMCKTKSGWHAARYDAARKQAIRRRVCDPRTLSVPCPVCQAPEGEMCGGKLGTSPVHERRRRAWKSSTCQDCHQQCAVRRSDGALIHPDSMKEDPEPSETGGLSCPARPETWRGNLRLDVDGEVIRPRVVATASLARGSVSRQWLLKVRCPYCGKTHTHGGGDGETPAGYYGHRVAHCGTKRAHTAAGYVLTDEHGNEPEMPAEAMAALKAAGRVS